MHIRTCQRDNCRESAGIRLDSPWTFNRNGRWRNILRHPAKWQAGSLKNCPVMKNNYSKCNIYKLYLDCSLNMWLIEKHGY